MTAPTLALEAIGSADGRALVVALHADLDERYAADDVADLDHSLETFLASTAAADVTPPHGAFVVARIAGAAVGCGAVRSTEVEGVGEIRRMYVVPAARGRGISRLLLARLEDEAVALGYQRLRLETGLRQPEAIALYESAGYGPVDAFGYAGAGVELSRCYGKPLPAGRAVP